MTIIINLRREGKVGGGGGGGGGHTKSIFIYPESFHWSFNKKSCPKLTLLFLMKISGSAHDRSRS